MSSRSQLLSVVVPVYNERPGLMQFHAALWAVLQKGALPFEVIYCDDGSTDGSLEILKNLAAKHPEARVLRLSRNFGKEVTTTAGIHAATGNAILMLDADGQYPVDVIPQFVEKWRAGARVVIGRPIGRKASLAKRLSSKLFYSVFRRVTGIKMDADFTDFRLIDRSVQAEFNQMTERNRITRGLIDWLGYDREYVVYRENARLAGKPTYSFGKLLKLAVDSVISLSLSPLYLTAYLGAIVLPLATLLGLVMGVNYLFSDPLNLHATGGAYLMVLILFLIGILLVSQGIIGLYLSHIHIETQNRPLYIIDKANSTGVHE